MLISLNIYCAQFAFEVQLVKVQISCSDISLMVSSAELFYNIPHIPYSTYSIHSIIFHLVLFSAVLQLDSNIDHQFEKKQPFKLRDMMFIQQNLNGKIEMCNGELAKMTNEINKANPFHSIDNVNSFIHKLLSKLFTNLFPISPNQSISVSELMEEFSRDYIKGTTSGHGKDVSNPTHFECFIQESVKMFKDSGENSLKMMAHAVRKLVERINAKSDSDEIPKYY